MDVFPDFGAVGGQAELRAIVGVLLIIVLIFAVLMLVICAAVWAISSANGNMSSAVRARVGVPRLHRSCRTRRPRRHLGQLPAWGRSEYLRPARQS